MTLVPDSRGVILNELVWFCCFCSYVLEEAIVEFLQQQKGLQFKFVGYLRPFQIGLYFINPCRNPFIVIPAPQKSGFADCQLEFLLFCLASGHHSPVWIALTLSD